MMILLVLMSSITANPDMDAAARDAIKRTHTRFLMLQRSKMPERYQTYAKAFDKPLKTEVFEVDDGAMAEDIPSIVTCEHFRDWVLITADNAWHKGALISVRRSGEANACAMADAWPARLRAWYEQRYGEGSGWVAVPGTPAGHDAPAFMQANGEIRDNWEGYPVGMIGDYLVVGGADDGFHIVDVRAPRFRWAESNAAREIQVAHEGDTVILAYRRAYGDNDTPEALAPATHPSPSVFAKCKVGKTLLLSYPVRLVLPTGGEATAELGVGPIKCVRPRGQ